MATVLGCFHRCHILVESNPKKEGYGNLLYSLYVTIQKVESNPKKEGYGNLLLVQQESQGFQSKVTRKKKGMATFLAPWRSFSISVESNPKKEGYGNWLPWYELRTNYCRK